MRAQLLVLTLNHVLFLVGHDFLPSLPLLAFFCVYVYVCMYVLVLRKNEFSDKHVKNDKLP
jgi:amino acid transporter